MGLNFLRSSLFVFGIGLLLLTSSMLTQASAASSAHCGLQAEFVVSDAQKAARDAKAVKFHKNVVAAIARKAPAAEFAALFQAVGEDIDPATGMWVKLPNPEGYAVSLAATDAAKTRYNLMWAAEFENYVPPGGVESLPTRESIGPPAASSGWELPTKPALLAVAKMVVAGCKPSEVATAIVAYDAWFSSWEARPSVPLNLKDVYFFQVPIQTPIVGMAIPRADLVGKGLPFEVRLPIYGTEAYAGIKRLPVDSH